MNLNRKLYYILQKSMTHPSSSKHVENFDFSNLIQTTNEVTSDFKNELLNEMNNQFNSEEQRIFVNSFYAYLNHHPTDDFVVDLDIVCKFIGFTRKDNIKRLILKNFSEVTDYQIVSLPKEENSTGRPNETIMLNVDTFKNICMLANTQQAKIIRTYYIKLESIVMKVINKSKQFAITKLTNKTKMIAKNDYIMDQFDKKPLAYIGLVNENIIKYGHTSDIKKRTSSHRKTYNENFNMVFAVENSSHYEVEKKFKNHNDLQSRKIKTYNGKEFNELLRIDENMTLKDVIQIMKSINIEVNQSVDLHLEQERTKQEQERTKQIEAQEKTKQLQLQIELEKIKIQQPVQVTNQTISEQDQQQIPNNNQIELTDEFKYSKVYLLEIMKSYPENPDNYGTGYNNYHGFSKVFKEKVEYDIKTKFGSKPIKNNGKIYYIGLRFKNSTSFYNHDVYKEFLDKYVYIPEQSIRFKKIPPGMFMYKVELNALYNHFIQFSETKTSIYDIQNTILFKKEFIEMVVKICKVKYPSYTNKTVRYFNGICLK